MSCALAKNNSRTAATLNDLFLTGADNAFYPGQDNGVPLTLMQPVNDVMKDVNREAITDFMKADPTYVSVAAEHAKGDCGQAEMRIAELLGCCGDMTRGYPGSDLERATAALRQIDLVLAKECTKQQSPQHLSLTLDSAGARLLRAQVLLANNPSGLPDQRVLVQASKDARAAASIVEDFTQKHPSESRRVWLWISEALQRAGDPWQALQFLATLDTRCCRQQQVAQIQGDLLFELQLPESASKAYSRWLSTIQTNDLCGNEMSVKNASELRRRGFSVPEIQAVDQATCLPLGGWAPYVHFSASE